MQAYMETEMPFYGVQKPARTKVMRGLAREYPPRTPDEHERLIVALSELPHREEKYLALDVAKQHSAFIGPESLVLYRKLIQDGAWWDFVDDVATHLVREIIREDPLEAWVHVDTWIDDQDMWLRRAAIICQIGLKEHTDSVRLFRFCSDRAFEKEFFIRKAIVWALPRVCEDQSGRRCRPCSQSSRRVIRPQFREATKRMRGLLQ